MRKETKNIFITTNVSCNLHCTYCYEDKSGINVFDVESTKDKLHDIFSKEPNFSFIINFHGGEPFLVFSKIRELCEWVWKQEFSNRCRFFASSNGTLVHGVIQDWLYANRERFTVGLSLDGTREMQNMNRSNSFDLIDIGFFVRTWPHQGVKMTISPKSIETLADGVIFMHSIGIHHILVNMAYLVDWGNDRFAPIYQREMRKLASFYKSYPELDKDSLFKLNFSSLISESARTERWCGAGLESIAYDIDGTCYPCPLFFESVCGKEKSQGWHNIDFSDPAEYISDECAKCQLYPTCPTCYGANYIERGNIGSRDMNLCRLERIRTYEVARYEYDRIVNSNTNNQSFSKEELKKCEETLKAIEEIMPLLNSIERELKDLGINV